MARFLKWIGCVTLCLALAMPGALAKPLDEEPPMTLSSPSAVLMEAETGAVLFEKSAQEARTAASLTKLMTLL